MCAEDKVKITAREILNAIETCAEMENAWHNGRTPGSGFKKSVSKMRKLLRGLLEVKPECLK